MSISEKQLEPSIEESISATGHQKDVEQEDAGKQPSFFFSFSFPLSST